jgi:hypothetical protein
MRTMSMMVMTAALLTSACAAVFQDQEAIRSRLTDARHCDGKHDAKLGTNFADCDQQVVNAGFEPMESPGASGDN